MSDSRSSARVAAGPPWESLRANLTGRLVLPSDAGYGLARQLQSAQFDDIRPRAVAYCANPDDVSVCLKVAADNDIPVAPRAGGHSNIGNSTTHGLVVDVSPINDVAAGPHTVRIGGGAQAVDVAAALAPHGIQVPSGTCPTVCVPGFLMGGGHGPQARKFGMACDRLVSADIVLADGSQVHASADSHPDLFWALRGGGGGNFGIVTRLELAPTQVPSMVNFNLYWDWSDALDVLTAWQHWVIDAPGELSSRVWVACPTGSPTPPQVLVHGSYLGRKADCERQLDRLVAAAGRPTTAATVEDLPYTRAMMQIYGCADRTVAQSHRIGYSPQAELPRDNYIYTRNRFFTRPVPASALSQALAAFTADPRPAQFRIFGMYAFGAQINALPRPATAYVHRDAQLSAFHSISLTTANPTQDDKAAATQWVTDGFATIDPHSNGESFQNFLDPSLKDWRTAYYGENYPRLHAVKRTYDPHTLFRFPLSIG